MAERSRDSSPIKLEVFLKVNPPILEFFSVNGGRQIQSRVSREPGGKIVFVEPGSTRYVEVQHTTAQTQSKRA